MRVVDPLPAASAIDADWLTWALGQRRDLGGARVVTVDATPLGTGQVGENVRFRVGWSADDPALPSSVVGKFPSDSEVSRAAAAATLTYVKEVGFYRDLQDLVAVRTPRILYLAEDLAYGRFVLLMEDITPAEQGDQLTGCTVEEAELAVAAAADLHGSTWGRAAELAALDWLELPDERRAADLAGLYAMCFPGFAARHAGDLATDDIELGRWFGQHLFAWAASFGADPCLTHNDFRLDNLLFGRGGGAPAVVVVDWQTVGIGSGPLDVAYFLGAGLEPASRAAHERALVARYVDRLSTHGVTLDPEVAWRDYRLGSASGYLMAVIASQLVVRTERGDAMFVAMASRHAEQMRHLDLPSMMG